ncbi:MAG: hypothetical protein ACFFDH_10640 [Promethearchaeota archaeon]
MLQELFIFFIVLVLSLFAKTLIQREKLGPFYPFILRMRLIGVAMHEISHYIMSLAVGIKPEEIRINWRIEETGQRNPHGYVIAKPRTFLQAGVICLGPLYISTWLIFLCISIIFNSHFNPLLKVLAGIFCISLILGAAPSNADFKNISFAIQERPSHSLYQLFLFFISGLLLWLFLLNTQIEFFLDVMYYLVIAGIYLLLKFSILGMKFLIIKIQSDDFRKPLKRKHLSSPIQHEQLTLLQNEEYERGVSYS